MSPRSRAEQPEDDIAVLCSRCRRRIIKVVTPGEREIEVYQDTDVRWHMTQDVKGERWLVTPVHAHAEHQCGGGDEQKG